MLTRIAGVFFITILSIFHVNAQYTPNEKKSDVSSFLNRVTNDTTDYYYVDFNKLSRQPVKSLPIGVFDSGTGGLTVLDAILGFDNFDITKKQYHSNGDGIKDFKNEQFIYFGDQANMPYGNYAAMEKTAFLKELILRDALFLLGNKSYNSPSDTTWNTQKKPVKMIVIACNTATAYGKDDIETMLRDAGNDTKVIGVIDAGVRGALATFSHNEDGTSAVIATAGTVSSNGYINAFYAQKSKFGYSGKFDFFQQSGFGIAEAIDEEPNFIDRNAKSIRTNYQGPSMKNKTWTISEELLPVYNFDTTGNKLLFSKENGKFTEIQLNHPENYIRYHLVNLCEQLRKQDAKKPLKTLILGCTHYPFYSSFFHQTLDELYNLKIDGGYIFRNVLSDSIILIDPALNTAREVHEYLRENNLLNRENNAQINEFYISVPDLQCRKIELDASDNFTYEYKYSRDVNHIYDTKQLPMSRETVNKDVLHRLQLQVPEIFQMVKKFENQKAKR